ncbi:MAG: alpha-glucosidase [bacterium]|nr:alpha-glucosidase [bacterium]
MSLVDRPCRDLQPALPPALAVTLFCLGLLLAAGAARAEPVGQSLPAPVPGTTAAVYHASAAARDEAPPSLCLQAPLRPDGPPPPGWSATPSLVPAFSRVQGRPAVFLPIADGTDLYGTGEVAGGLRRNRTRTVAWNTDAYGWQRGELSLYQSHPWVLAVRRDGTAYGVIADTPERCLIDLNQGIRFEAAGPEFAVIVVEGPTPQHVVRALGALTGTMPLPPRWALGYHQCRYSYTPDDRVREIAEGFRKRAIPCDVIWLDIDYMDGFRCFTVDTNAFPDLRGLDGELQAQGFRTVAIIDPGIKLEDGYHVFDSGAALDAWVQTPRGKPYEGAVWPGNCVFPDFTIDRVRAWWGGLYGQFLSLGIDGIWNDMNEPAVFNVDGHTMPATNVHRADPDLGGTGTHARFHNVYGMLMSQATYEGVAAARPQQRPFVLTRASHLGGQRWAATWTGDNTASWDHLDMSLAMVLNLGLSGQPLSGPDIGGFVGAGDGPLFARWMGVGALLPFARGHTGKGNIDKEPWSFGREVENTCRLALQRRSRLLPYLYTLAREASLTGLPIARPLFFADPADPALRDMDDAFLLGDDLLVVANVKPGPRDPAAPLPPLSRGAWTEISLVDGDQADPDLPRLFLREGAALPLGPLVQWSDEKPLDEIELLVNPDAAGRAVGSLYEDAGDGPGYRDQACRLTRFTYEAGKSTAVVVEGEWPAGDWRVTTRAVGGR